jgi:hypothetical protein
MIAGFVAAAFVAFFSGFVLRMGAFTIFALILSILNLLLLLYTNHGIIGSLVRGAALLLVLETGYVVGVIVPPLIRRSFGRGIGFFKSKPQFLHMRAGGKRRKTPHS